jgi:hypothetical protein
MTRTLDFSRSYLRFYLDFTTRQAISLSHKPPTQTNRTRIMLEASCRLTHRPTGKSTLYVLSAACKTEQVGAQRDQLWITPNADAIFLASDDGQFAIHKSWHKNNPGVMRFPPTLGPQPERQVFAAKENFDDLRLDLCEVDAESAQDFEQAGDAILGTRPIVSRIEYREGDYDVCLDQPVKTINLCERERLFQTDTGPIPLPELTPGRIAAQEHMIGVFDLAYSAFHARDWAEFVINVPTTVADGVSVNHYSKTRRVEPTRNTLLVLR